mmetsp:Transcript_3625/g.12612  ORF Transcript_3625/g.12612 Transcript_3625/m.12612 type:complete len:209 (-) Transcript_3625:84-710(-)
MAPEEMAAYAAPTAAAGARTAVATAGAGVSSAASAAARTRRAAQRRAARERVAEGRTETRLTAAIARSEGSGGGGACAADGPESVRAELSHEPHIGVRRVTSQGLTWHNNAQGALFREPRRVHETQFHDSMNARATAVAPEQLHEEGRDGVERRGSRHCHVAGIDAGHVRPGAGGDAGAEGGGNWRRGGRLVPSAASFRHTPGHRAVP